MKQILNLYKYEKLWHIKISRQNWISLLKLNTRSDRLLQKPQLHASMKDTGWFADGAHFSTRYGRRRQWCSILQRALHTISPSGHSLIGYSITVGSHENDCATLHFYCYPRAFSRTLLIFAMIGSLYLIVSSTASTLTENIN